MTPTHPGGEDAPGSEAGVADEDSCGRNPSVDRSQNFRLELPDVPPSLNRVGSRGKSHWPYTNAKKKWEGMFFIALLQAKVPKDLLSVDAEASLRFKSRRRRDEGNFRMLLEKALGDILVTGGWLPDDIPELYAFNSVKFEEETGEPRTIVRLMVNP